MRWFGGIAVGLAVLWAAYLGSPYWTLLFLATAIDRHDVAAAAAHVNIHAVRNSLAKQAVGEGLLAADLADVVAGTDARMAAGTLSVAVGPFVGNIVTETAVADLVRDATGPDGGATAPSRLAGAGGPIGRFFGVLTTSRWRGFRNVYFTLPPGRPADRQVRLQLRLSRLSWRLVSIDLPAPARKRLAKRLVDLRAKLRASPAGSN